MAGIQQFTFVRFLCPWSDTGRIILEGVFQDVRAVAKIETVASRNADALLYPLIAGHINTERLLLSLVGENKVKATIANYEEMIMALKLDQEVAFIPDLLEMNIFQYIEGQTLDRWLESRDAKNSSPATDGCKYIATAELKHDRAWSRPVLVQILNQIEKLHQCGVVYNDLSLENIIIDAAETAHIIDFADACTAVSVPKGRARGKSKKITVIPLDVFHEGVPIGQTESTVEQDIDDFARLVLEVLFRLTQEKACVMLGANYYPYQLGMNYEQLRTLLQTK
jgi:serine/threonine protein kinase